MESLNVVIKGGRICLERSNTLAIQLSFDEASGLLEKLLKAVMNFSKINSDNSRKQEIQELKDRLRVLEGEIK